MLLFDNRTIVVAETRAARFDRYARRSRTKKCCCHKGRIGERVTRQCERACAGEANAYRLRVPHAHEAVVRHRPDVISDRDHLLYRVRVRSPLLGVAAIRDVELDHVAGVAADPHRVVRGTERRGMRVRRHLVREQLGHDRVQLRRNAVGLDRNARRKQHAAGTHLRADIARNALSMIVVRRDLEHRQ